MFNLLEEVVSDEHGTDVWDDLLVEAGVDGAFSSLGNYPDAELLGLVGAASVKLGLEADAIVRWFGARAIPLLAREYPAFFAPHRTTRDFLLTLNSVIHPEVRMIYPGADVPEFDFGQDEAGALVIGYASQRKLCSLAEGFIDGTASHYGENVAIHQTACMKQGAERCRIVVSTRP